LPWVQEFQLEVAGNDLTVVIEPLAQAELPSAPEAVAAKAIQDRLYFRPAVRLAPAGALTVSELKSRRVVRLP
jgi:phenylacetate-coenzyme A ligase PaaK-like adenylate-forming protein